MKLLCRDFSGLTESECIKIQQELSPGIVQKNAVATEDIHTVAGVDIAYWQADNAEWAVCCIVVIDVKSRTVTEKDRKSTRLNSSH